MSWYYVFWGTGCTAGALLAGRIAQNRGVPFGQRLVVILAAVAGFLWGVAAQFRLEHYEAVQAMLFRPSAVFDGGHRLPLGLLIGSTSAFLAARLVRATWAPIAAGLAIGTCLMIAIGRIGCFLNGCCSGLVCTAWTFPCIRYGPGSEAHGLQLAHRLIAPGTPLSLPVHPLPLYFLVTAAALGGWLWWLLRRGTRPAVVAMLFAVIYPATQLALELLRASTQGHPTGLRLWGPVAGMVVGGILLARDAWAGRPTLGSDAPRRVGSPVR